MKAPTGVEVLDARTGGLSLPIVETGGAARAVVWPGMGATLRSLHTISLGSSARTVELRHPMEAVYYVISGTAEALDSRDGTQQRLVAGSFAHIEPGTPYVFSAGPDGAELVGGPCPPDPALYSGLTGGA
jgi:mannose-6-phosphate isomerase-like protein (cupin superfamily)